MYRCSRANRSFVLRYDSVSRLSCPSRRDSFARRNETRSCFRWPLNRARTYWPIHVQDYFTGSCRSLLSSSRDDRSRPSWISPLLAKSRQQRTLHLTDLYDLLPEYESATLTDRLENHWLDEVKRRPSKPSLLRASIRTMGWKPLINGLYLLPMVRARSLLFPTCHYSRLFRYAVSSFSHCFLSF